MSALVPAISVVVATRGRAGRLAELVEALEDQDIDKPFEVVIVDDGSKDQTWSTLQELARRTTFTLVPVRHDRNRGAAAARNSGWRAARAPLVAFTDDDCAPTTGWLAALHRALGAADLVQGVTLPNPAQTHLFGPFSRSLTETEEGTYPTANVAYRRAALELVGGFDERYSACEDTDLAMRVLEAGGRSAFVPEALVHHAVHVSDFRAYWREKKRWQAVPLIVREHPGLRLKMHNRLFWRPSHPPALAAGFGLAVAGAAAVGRFGPGMIAGALLQWPYLRFRSRSALVPGGRRRWIALPLLLIGDVYEVLLLLTASVRHRTLVL